jgi:DNA-binding transcriptional LysR family regulator
MLGRFSLDQLRAFITAADDGSFSAAARRLYRAQSVVSELVSRLEAELGVQLFDRSGRRPKLTKAGEVLLADARAIVADVDFMRARAKGIAGGVEAELSIVVDVMFPIDAVTKAAQEFRQSFPATPLRLFMEGLGSAYELLLDKRASLGIIGGQQAMPASLMGESLPGTPMVIVASANHPLAAHRGAIPNYELAKHTQLVLTDRSLLSQGREYFVKSPSTWRLADLFVKRAFLLAGLGWGYMPTHSIEAEIQAGELVVLKTEGASAEPLVRPLSAVYPIESPPGPAGRWFIEQLAY